MISNLEEPGSTSVALSPPFHFTKATMSASENSSANVSDGALQNGQQAAAAVVVADGEKVHVLFAAIALHARPTTMTPEKTERIGTTLLICWGVFEKRRYLFKTRASEI